MAFTDILILVGLLLFLLLGFRDGFFKKVFGILGFIAGLVCATKFMNPLGEKYVQWLNMDKETALTLAFFSIFMGIVLIEILFYRWFGRSGSETLKFWSRVAGGIIGVMQGLLAISLILIMFNIYEVPSEESKNDSILYDPVFRIAPTVFNYTTTWMPETKEFYDELKQHFEHLKVPSQSP